MVLVLTHCLPNVTPSAPRKRDVDDFLGVHTTSCWCQAACGPLGTDSACTGQPFPMCPQSHRHTPLLTASQSFVYLEVNKRDIVMLQRLKGFTLCKTPSAACGVFLWGRPAWRHRGCSAVATRGMRATWLGFRVAEEIGAEHLDPIISCDSLTRVIMKECSKRDLYEHEFCVRFHTGWFLSVLSVRDSP